MGGQLPVMVDCWPAVMVQMVQGAVADGAIMGKTCCAVDVAGGAAARGNDRGGMLKQAPHEHESRAAAVASVAGGLDRAAVHGGDVHCMAT